MFKQIILDQGGMIMQNLILIVGIVCMFIAIGMQIIVGYSKQVCSSWQLTYKETSIAGGIMFLLSWILAVQSGNYATQIAWMNRMGMFFSITFGYGIVSGLLWEKQRTRDQKVACQAMRKSALIMSIILFVAGYLLD